MNRKIDRYTDQLEKAVLHQGYWVVSVSWLVCWSVDYVHQFMCFRFACPAYVPEWTTTSLLLSTHKPCFYSCAIYESHFGLSVCWFVHCSDIFVIFFLHRRSYHSACMSFRIVAPTHARLILPSIQFFFLFFCTKSLTQENLLEVFWPTYCSCSGEWAQI